MIKAKEQVSEKVMSPEVHFGYWVIAIFVIILLVWAALIPLATGAIAPGVVGVEGNSQIIQHLSGGRVQEILTKDGDLVSKGEVLVALDDAPLKSRLSALRSQYVLLLARKSRLEAESLSKVKITYSNWLLQRKSEADVTVAINNQERIFHSELVLLNDQETTYGHRITQARRDINSNESRLAVIDSRERQAKIELGKYKQLLAQGLVTRSQIFALDSAYRDIQDMQQSLKGDISSTQALISQYESELSAFKAGRRNLAAKSLDALEGQLASVEKDLSVTQGLFKQAEIRAPIDGYIVNLMINTVGGVIAPGQTVMEIIPSTKKLIIKANMKVKDRPSIKIGQSAEVRFTAFSRRNTQPVGGSVTVISADRLIDPVTNTPFYGASIELSGKAPLKINGQIIYPGMQAEVIISTGERTTLDYLISPLTQSFNRALREE